MATFKPTYRVHCTPRLQTRAVFGQRYLSSRTKVCRLQRLGHAKGREAKLSRRESGLLSNINHSMESTSLNSSKNNESGRSRTHNIRVRSAALYPLSYTPIFSQADNGTRTRIASLEDSDATVAPYPHFNWC